MRIGGRRRASDGRWSRRRILSRIAAIDGLSPMSRAKGSITTARRYLISGVETVSRLHHHHRLDPPGCSELRVVTGLRLGIGDAYERGHADSGEVHEGWGLVGGPDRAGSRGHH